jgi:hypothetical protein
MPNLGADLNLGADHNLGAEHKSAEHSLGAEHCFGAEHMFLCNVQGVSIFWCRAVACKVQGVFSIVACNLGEVMQMPAAEHSNTNIKNTVFLLLFCSRELQGVPFFR